MRERFIVLEGIDGCGKSTQAEMLVKYFEGKGKSVALTREHTRDLAAGQLIDQIVNHQGELVPVAMQLLYVVDRIDHTARCIRPPLDEGKIVVCDRYFWSTVAYSNLCGEQEWFLRIQKHVIIEPDLTIWVDIDPELAMERMGKRGKDFTIFEKIEKLKKIREGYQWLADKYKKKCLVVDGSGTPEEIHQRVAGYVSDRYDL